MPPGSSAEAVVIENAMRPFAAQLAIVDAADEGGVLARHRRLVAVAVERPGLHLRLVELAAVQHVMKGMQVVIALRRRRRGSRLRSRPAASAARCPDARQFFFSRLKGS